MTDLVRIQRALSERSVQTNTSRPCRLKVFHSVSSKTLFQAPLGISYALVTVVLEVAASSGVRVVFDA